MLGIAHVVNKVLENSFIIDIQVQPNSKRNEIVGYNDNLLKIKIAAPPVEGKANKVLIDFLSRALALKKSQIKIERGETARRKRVALAGIDNLQFRERIELWKNR